MQRQDIPLTKREAEIAHLVSIGLSNQEIGNRLGVKSTTVSGTLTSIFYKLGVSSRKRLIVKFFTLKQSKNSQIIDKLLEALEFECGGRCAPQNPCNARETIEEIRSLYE